MFGNPLFQCVRGEGAHDCPPSGKDSQGKTENRSSENRAEAVLPVLYGGEKPLELRSQYLNLSGLLLEILQHFADTEQPHNHWNQTDSVGEG